MAGSAPIAAGTASALVRRAHARWRRLRALEALLLALCAALVTFAAAVLSGASVAAASSCAAALVSALACAGTWYHEHRLAERELARRLDLAGAAGLLSTAWEHEQGALPGSPLHAVLRARLYALVAGKAAASLVQRAAPAPAPVFCLLPLAALALCAFSLELAPGRGRGTDLTPLAAALAEGVAALASEPGADRAVAERVAGLARRVAEADVAGAAELDQRLREVADELQALLGGLPAGAARSTLERAHELASVLGAEAGAARPAPAPGSAPSPARGAAALAPGASERTMGGSSPAAAGAREPAPLAGRRSAEAGTAAGRFWPEHYDAIVSGWLERRGSRRNEHQETGIGREQR
jgi:hypothetical protein